MHVTRIAALNRRSFVFRAIQLAAAPALLVGCGGGGSNDEATPPVVAEESAATATMVGQVVMPAGLSLAGTRVGHLLGDEEVAPSGAFEISFVPDSAMPTTVFNAAGNPLLFGFLRAAQPTLSVHSSAEVLMFRALGMWVHTGEVQVAALKLLAAEDLSTIETAIGVAIAMHGTTWANFTMAGDVGRAVAAKVAALGGGAVSPAQTRRRALGTIVDPTDRKSGLIIEGDGISGCSVENDFRRRTLIVHTEVAAKLENETTEFDLARNYVNTELSPTDGVSSPLQVIADYFEGKNYYTPVTVNLVTPLYPSTAVYTRYRVYAVGPGSSLGAWNDMPQNVKEDGLLLIFRAVLFDFVVPVLASLLIPVNADKINKARNFEYADAPLKDLAVLFGKIPEIVEVASRGDFKATCSFVLNYLLRGTDSTQIAALAILAGVFKVVFGVSIVVNKKTGRLVVYTDFIKKFWDIFDKVLDAEEFGLTVFDTAVQVCDIASSAMGEIWDVTITKAKVRIDPKEFFVEKSKILGGITATVVDGQTPEGTYLAYNWKCKSGHVYDSLKYGTELDSSTYKLIGYDAVSVAAGTIDEIEVIVKLRGTGVNDPVGSAKARVYVTGLTVSPEEKKKLKASESVTLTAATVGMRPLAAGEAIVYKWTLGGTAGALTATDTATATFKADAKKEGLAVVTVEAFLGEQRIGMATSNLTVGNKLVVAGRMYEVHYKDENCHTGMYLAVPKIEGATHYEVYVTGMRGSYFGTEYTWIINVNPGGAVSPEWQLIGKEYVTGIGGGGGGGADCIDAPDGRWAAWYQGSTVQVTVTL